MHPTLSHLADGIIFTGGTRADAVTFFVRHGCQHTAGHCARVATAARRIAMRYGADEHAAWVAGWLHDISTPVPNSERIALAEALGLKARD